MHTRSDMLRETRAGIGNGQKTWPQQPLTAARPYYTPSRPNLVPACVRRDAAPCRSAPVVGAPKPTEHVMKHSLLIAAAILALGAGGYSAQASCVHRTKG